MVTIHIPLAPDLRRRLFAATGVAAPTAWTIEADPRALDEDARVHLLRMADRDTLVRHAVFGDHRRAEPGEHVWVGTYTPNPDRAAVERATYCLPLAAAGDEALVVRAILRDHGVHDDDGEDAAAPNDVAAAAIRADRLRWEAARDTALAALHDAVAAWIVRAEARAADLRTRGGSALTPREIEDGPIMMMAMYKPSWFDAVVTAADACGARAAAAWDALSAAWMAAYAEACAERDARRRAEKEAEEAAEGRRQAEIRAWIAAHGSDRLRRLLDAGYPIWQEYVRERVAREFPGFTPDLNREARWRDLLKETDPAPTDEQIALAQRFGGRAVLLTCDTRDYRRSAVAVVIADAFHGMTLVETAVDAREDDEA
jgi:hypothetical protein